MLNRAKKNLIALLVCASLTLPAFAFDSTISYVNINNRAFYDVEIVLTNDNRVLVPFKQLAELFDIPFEANRVDKKISFKTFEGKDGMITERGVFVEDTPISKTPPLFMTQGLIDGVFNEAYLTEDVVSKIMGITLQANFEDLTLTADVKRDISLLRKTNNIIDDNVPRAYSDVVSPNKRGKITLNKIGFRTNFQSDNMSVKGNNYKTVNDTINGTDSLSINGNFFDGQYRIEATDYHYRSKAFMFGGLTGTYMNSFRTPDKNKEMFYELGKVTGRTDIDASIGTNIFGAQIWNYDYKKEAPEDIHGYVGTDSLVKLTVNNLEPILLSTYAGYYSLKDVQLPNPVLSIKIEEVKPDGTEVLIREEKYSIFGKDTPLEKENRYSAYAGVWGYQNRLFREGQNIYRGNNKKLTAGGYYQYGLKDNVTFESKLTGDKIYKKETSTIMYSLPTHDALLVSGTQKSVNYLQGATSLNSLEWKNPNNKNIKARLTAGASIANDIRDRDTHAGYIVKGTTDYEKNFIKQIGIFKPKKFNARLEAFNTSPDFYIASSDSTSKNDRTGGKATAGFSFNQTSASGSYSRYYSNINHRYQGGSIHFDEVSINGATKIPKTADLSFNSYYRRGANHLGRNRNYNYDANASREFGRWAKLQIGRRESLYDTKYGVETITDRNYYSKYADNYAQLDIPIPHNYGKFSFGHSFVNFKTNTYKNDYNMFRFGYVFPTWKRITLGLGWGFRYHGQKGQDFNVNVSYRARSGQTMSVGYQYSQNGGYFIDNMFMPTSNRHSVNFAFNDAFQIFHHGLKSVGEENLNQGIFEAIAFVDVNKNGKYEKGVDIPVKDVPLITSWSGEPNATNKRGRVYYPTLEQGVYTVSIDMDNLPIIVAPLTNDKIKNRIKIDGGQTTILEIPLASTVGSISGVLKISDDFNRELRLNDFVVVLLDDNGNEVNYSTLSDNGEFYISGLAPGRYTLKLDENFVNAYGLEEVANKSEINVIIPFDYENPIDITDINLEYKTISL